MLKNTWHFEDRHELHYFSKYGFHVLDKWDMPLNDAFVQWVEWGGVQLVVKAATAPAYVELLRGILKDETLQGRFAPVC